MPEFLEMHGSQTVLGVLFARSATDTEVHFLQGAYVAAGRPGVLSVDGELLAVGGSANQSLTDSPAVTVNVAPGDTTLTVASTAQLYGDPARGLEQQVRLVLNGSAVETLFVTDVLSGTVVTVRRPAPSTTTLTAGPSLLVEVVDPVEVWGVTRGQFGSIAGPIGRNASAIRVFSTDEIVTHSFLSLTPAVVGVSIFDPNSGFPRLGHVLPFSATGLRRPNALFARAAAVTVLSAGMHILPEVQVPYGTDGPAFANFRIRYMADPTGIVFPFSTSDRWNADGDFSGTTLSFTSRDADTAEFKWVANSINTPNVGALRVVAGGFYQWQLELFRAAG